MANSSTYIMDLPDNVVMSPFSEQSFTGNGRQNMDRSVDLESTSYRQMNPHQNPYIQGQPRMDSMPLPEYGGRGTMPLPPSFDQGPLGNSPSMPLPPKDIPLDTSGFRDETAKPNYIPPANPRREDYVRDQEDRIKETRQTEETKKAVNRKFDLLAEMQMPLIVAILFWIFQIEAINRLMARYLKFAGLFGEDGNMNIWGILAKSTAFGSCYYGVVNAVKFVE